jgi:hypothetical protein
MPIEGQELGGHLATKKQARAAPPEVETYAAALVAVALDRVRNAVGSPTVTVMPDFKTRLLAAKAAKLATASAASSANISVTRFWIRTR